MLLREFSERFELWLHQLLWRQWCRLGTFGSAVPEDRWVLDPETLLAFTLEAARSEPRLFDEVLDWLQGAGGLIDVQRLRNLVRQDADYPVRLLVAVASLLSDQVSSVKWQRLGAMERASDEMRVEKAPESAPESLFLSLARLSAPPVEKPDPRFLCEGYVRPTFEPRGHALSPPLEDPTCVRLRLRALFGIGLRAEIVTYLLLREEAGGNEIAQAAGYTLPGALQTLRDMASSGFVLARTVQGKRRFALARERWGELHALVRRPLQPRPISGAEGSLRAATAEPRFLAYVDWARAFRGFARILRFVRNTRLWAEQEYLQASEFRKVVEAAREDLETSGLGLRLPEQGDQQVHTYKDQLMAAFESWFERQELDPPDTPRTTLVFGTAAEDRIYKRLLLLGDGPASFFRDACWLMHCDRPPASVTHLVGHCLREVASCVRTLGVLGQEDRQLGGYEAHVRDIRLTLQALDLPADQGVGLCWIERCRDFHKEAHRDTLCVRSLKDEFREFWGDVLSIFDAVLERFSTRFGRLLDHIDDRMTNPPDRTKAARDALVWRHPSAAARVFKNALDAGWIEPFRKAGAFEDPPGQRVDPERDDRYWPEWPASRWLAQMAGKEPAAVLGILSTWQSCDNPRVWRDVVNAASAMPANLASQMTHDLDAWLRRAPEIDSALSYADLIIRLAKAGETAAALQLAAALFRVRPARHDESSTHPVGVATVVAGLLPPDEYAARSHDVVPHLVEAADVHGLAVFCQLLQEAMEIRSRSTPTCESDEALAPQHRDIALACRRAGRDVECALLAAVCQAATRVGEKDPSRLSAVADAFARYPHPVFRACELYVLATIPQAPARLLAARLLDADLIHSPEYAIEYRRLLRDKGALLSRVDQREWGKRRREGPNTNLAPPWEEPRPPAPEPEPPAAAPMPTVAELRKEQPSSVVQHVAAWLAEPSTEAARPVREGCISDWDRTIELIRRLTEVVRERGPEFASAADELPPLPPFIASAFADGWADVAKAGTTFDWGRALRWLGSIESTPAAGVGESGAEFGGLLGGSFAFRRSLLHLLDRAFADGPGSLAVDQAQTAWEILEPLTRDPDPSPKREKHHDHKALWAYELCINTIRGDAIQQVVRFAHWYWRRLEPDPQERARTPLGLDRIPHARCVLDGHLDTALEPSCAVRSAYGRMFCWLAKVDPSWMRRSVERIFPSGAENGELWRSAWDAYVTFSPVHDAVLPLLRPHYRRAVEELCPAGDLREAPQFAHPDEGLLRHLLVYYARGRTELDPDDGMLGTLMARGSDRVRARAMAIVGQWLRDEEAPLDPEILGRFKRLWEARASVVRPPDARQAGVEEMAAFGGWFLSARLDDGWAMPQLLNVARVAGRLELDRGVLDRLAGLASRYPRESVEILDRLVHSPRRDPWDLAVWREAAERILHAGFDSIQADVREMAERVRSAYAMQGLDLEKVRGGLTSAVVAGGQPGQSP